ncbi:MAG: hypothetical protein WCK90_05045 [archaeon]
MIPLQYLVAVHRALVKRESYSSQKALDGIVQASCQSMPGLENQMMCSPLDRASLFTGPFMLASKIKRHISGAVIKEPESSYASIYHFVRKGDQVKADYHTARLVRAEDLKGELMSWKPSTHPVWKEFGAKDSVQGTPSAIVNPIIRSEFALGKSYVELLIRKDGPGSMLWMFMDSKTGNPEEIEDHGHVGVIGRKYDDEIYLGLEDMPSNGRCRYDRNKLVREGFVAGHEGNFRELAYHCGNCNSIYKKPTPKIERLRAERLARKRDREVVYGADQEMTAAVA